MCAALPSSALLQKVYSYIRMSSAAVQHLVSKPLFTLRMIGYILLLLTHYYRVHEIEMTGNNGMESAVSFLKNLNKRISPKSGWCDSMVVPSSLFPKYKLDDCMSSSPLLFGPQSQTKFAKNDGFVGGSERRRRTSACCAYRGRE